MADINGITLGMAIQAVQSEIQRFEQLLTSETLRDPADVQDLIFAYERTAETLKAAYISDWTEGTSLPTYDELVKEGRHRTQAEVIKFPSE